MLPSQEALLPASRDRFKESAVYFHAYSSRRKVIAQVRLPCALHFAGAVAAEKARECWYNGRRVDQSGSATTVDDSREGEDVRGAGEIILDIVDVSKTFGGLQAVRRCSLQVRRGTITGLIGPNGAGKTTLFNLISGFVRPDSGWILFHGQRIDGLPPHRIFRRGLCRTFQVPRELPEMTVLENLMLVPASQQGERLWPVWLLPWQVRAQERAIQENALEVLEFVNLYPLRHEYAGRLSTGQKKLLELARAMMADPTLILLDEPGAGVNPTLMRSLVERIERLVAERGVTVFLIEHDMDLVMRICNPVIVMSNGEKLTEGTPAEIQRDPQVLAAYLGGRAV